MTEYERTDDYFRQMFALYVLNKIVVPVHHHIHSIEPVLNLMRCLLCRLFFIRAYHKMFNKINVYISIFG